MRGKQNASAWPVKVFQDVQLLLQLVLLSVFPLLEYKSHPQDSFPKHGYSSFSFQKGKVFLWNNQAPKIFFTELAVIWFMGGKGQFRQKLQKTVLQSVHTWFVWVRCCNASIEEGLPVIGLMLTLWVVRHFLSLKPARYRFLPFYAGSERLTLSWYNITVHCRIWWLSGSIRERSRVRTETRWFVICSLQRS